MEYEGGADQTGGTGNEDFHVLNKDETPGKHSPENKADMSRRITVGSLLPFIRMSRITHLLSSHE
jgi:hypothetical protein